MQVLGRIYELVITNATKQTKTITSTPIVVQPSANNEDVPDSGSIIIVQPSANNDDVPDFTPQDQVLLEQQGITVYSTSPINSRTIPIADKTKSRKWSGDLRLQATISKNNTNSNTNNVTINLYNPSKEDLSFITTKADKRYISLRAGYKSVKDGALVDEFDGLPEVFTGDIINITSQRQGVDLVMTVVAKDSAASLRKGIISKTFPKGTDKKTAIKDIINSWDGIIFTNNSISSEVTFTSSSFTSSFTAYGNIGSVLDEITRDEDIVWHITNNIFYMIGKSEPKLTTKLTLTPDNVINDINNIQQSNLNGKTPQGLKLRTFLEGLITTSTFIALSGFDSLDPNNPIDGDYNVRTIKHVMDTHGQAWYTECTVEAR